MSSLIRKAQSYFKKNSIGRKWRSMRTGDVKRKNPAFFMGTGVGFS